MDILGRLFFNLELWRIFLFFTLENKKYNFQISNLPNTELDIYRYEYSTATLLKYLA